VSYIAADACTVEWMPLKPMGDDAIVYILQMSVGHTTSYKQVSGPTVVYVISKPQSVFALFYSCTNKRLITLLIIKNF